MSLSRDELRWAQPKHRMYQAVTQHGYYWIIAQDRDWRFNSRLLYVAASSAPSWDLLSRPKQQHLAHGRIRFLMTIAEIDSVLRV